MVTRIFRDINDETIAFSAKVIREGGLVAFPTETVYGLGANALDADAAAKIYKAKGRPSDNPLIVHLAEYGEAVKYCYPTPLFYRLAEVFMPGPLTVIMPKRNIIPDGVTGGLDSVGIRVPSNAVAHRLIEASGVPIAAPSANISGKPSPTKFSHIEHDLTGRADVLIDGGDCQFGLESTVIRLDGDDIALLRPGAVTVEMLLPFCKNLTVDRAVTERFDGKPLAPGMKYRHYAPDAPLVILDGSDAEVYGFLEDKTGCGILCYEEDVCLLKRENALSIGSRHDMYTQAHRLFSCLRSFKNVNIIYARMPEKTGIGLAVFNRLIKAAGYTVIIL